MEVATADDQRTAFTAFVGEVEPRLRRALVALRGRDADRDATAEALAWAWEHWDQVQAMDNPAGYLYRVGTSRSREKRRALLPVEGHAAPPGFETGLGPALAALTDRQRADAWGTGRICSVEYGEVVLVDEAGRLLRAYPMPGEVPTWIYPTKDAVYAGRVGDGALPESTIVRIDRRTLEAEVLVFPAEGGLLGVDLPGWSTAPSSADIAQLVVVGDDSAGPLVASRIGMTSVDLDAVEELFA
jgi:hypothetical protein